MARKQNPTAAIHTTADLSEASAISLYVSPKHLEVSGSKVFFIFEDPRAEELSAKYWAGQLRADLRKYASAFRELKDRLFAVKRGQDLRIA